MCLNEAFISEKDPCRISVYSLIANGTHLGRMRSSGILASTGTGSSGWLYGAKRMTSYNVRAIIKELQKHNELNKAQNNDIDELGGLFLDDELAN